MDIHYDKKKYIQQNFLGDESTKISQNAFLEGEALKQFEYPYVFLDLINYLSGV